MGNTTANSPAGEESKNTSEKELQAGGKEENPGQEGAEKTGEPDWKKQAKKWENRAKQNLAELDGLKETLAELQKSKDEKLAEALKPLEAQLAQYRQAEQLREWATEASKAHGVPVELLRGSTEEEIGEHAKALAEFLRAKPKQPVVKDEGKRPGNSSSPALDAVRALFGHA